MIARKVYVRLKPEGLPAFIELIEKEISPWLRTQEGFLELIALAASDGIEVQVLSFWDHEGKTEDYKAIDYPADALRTLQVILDGVTYGRTFEVVSSTLAKSSAGEPLATDREGAAISGSSVRAISIS